MAGADAITEKTDLETSTDLPICPVTTNSQASPHLNQRGLCTNIRRDEDFLSRSQFLQVIDHAFLKRTLVSQTSL